MTDLREKLRLRLYGESWHDLLSLEQANAIHEENVIKVTEALELRKDRKRPIHIVGIAGSNRNVQNCSHETSNSWLMIRKAMEYCSRMEDVATHAFNLSSMDIEHCNGCYSSTSSLCRFPCDCHVVDDMHEVYVQLTLADGILFSTPVNQYLPGSRMKALLDRLISMDGGRFAPRYNVDGETWKNTESKNAEQRVAVRGDFRYVQRLAGKVCAVFATSKDYGSFKVAQDILAGMNMYGCFIPPNAILNWNSPRVAKDTAYDKADFLQALEGDGWIGRWIEQICDTVVETARLVRGKETLWMEHMTGRS